MPRLVWILVALLIVLHQDNWFWIDERLVFGFLPIGLFYHACISMAAGFVWWLAVRHCWPSDLGDAAPKSARREGGGA